MRVLSDQNFHCKLHRNGGKQEALCFARKWNSEGEVGCKYRRRRWRTERHEPRSFGAGLVPMNRAGVESQWGPETSSKKKDKEPHNDRKEIQRRWQGRLEGWCKDVRPRRKLIWLRTSIRRVPGKLRASITKKTKGGGRVTVWPVKTILEKVCGTRAGETQTNNYAPLSFYPQDFSRY